MKNFLLIPCLLMTLFSFQVHANLDSSLSTQSKATNISYEPLVELNEQADSSFCSETTVTAVLGVAAVCLSTYYYFLARDYLQAINAMAGVI